jgi:riboflavin synthase alpha subunit
MFIYLRMALTVLLSAVLAFQIHAAETKKVCNAQKDKKGKEVQVCREVKVHKKLDGTKVPPK